MVYPILLITPGLLMILGITVSDIYIDIFPNIGPLICLPLVNPPKLTNKFIPVIKSLIKLSLH